MFDVNVDSIELEFLSDGTVIVVEIESRFTDKSLVFQSLFRNQSLIHGDMAVIDGKYQRFGFIRGIAS